MAPPPDMTAKYLVGIARKLQLRSGAFPSGRAVREAALQEAMLAKPAEEDPPRCGSKRATDAALALKICQGLEAHLRNTLTADFQALLPVTLPALPLPDAELRRLPTGVQASLQMAVVSLATEYERDRQEQADLAAVERNTYVEQTTQMREEMNGLAEELDTVRDKARADADANRASLAELRTSVAVLEEKISNKDRELATESEGHGRAKTELGDVTKKWQAAEVAGAAMSAELAMLRADSVRLTTAMTEQAAELIALRADRVRLTTELAARDERDKAPKEQPRRRTKAVAA